MKCDNPPFGDGEHVLVGRDAELALIADFTARIATSGDALVLLGDPGVGKSALLDAAALRAQASQIRVLRSRGVEFEAAAPYACLRQTLLPLNAEISELSAAQSGALNAALGFTEDWVPERLAVAAATLSLVQRAATRTAVLVIVDDLQWVDRGSARVLGFLARRAGIMVGFLAATRTGEESFFEREGLRDLELKPLSADPANELLTARYPDLAPRVRSRLLQEAQGNPLGLLELPAALSESQRAAQDELPAQLPVTTRLQALFRSKVAKLAAPTRSLLLLLALDGSGDPRTLDAMAPEDDPLAALAEAERAGLARMHENHRGIEFRHPLIPEAVVAMSTIAERRVAHTALAGLWERHPDQRAWHLAEAATGPDEAVAVLLEEVAFRSLRCGDGVGAVNALIRAADLSADTQTRARRLDNAAFAAPEISGQLSKVHRLLHDAGHAAADPNRSLESAAAAAVVLLNGDGDIDTAHRLVLGAVETSEAQGGRATPAAVDAANTLIMLCHYACRADLWKPFERVVDDLGSGLPPFLHLSMRTLGDPARQALPVLGELDAAIAELNPTSDPAHVIRVGVAGFFAHRLPACRNALKQVAQQGRAGDAAALLIHALHLLAADSYYAGEWDLAEHLATEAAQVCHENGYGFQLWPGRHLKAQLAARRGDEHTLRALTQQMLQWALPKRIVSVQLNAQHSLCVAALGRGEFEDAYRHATAISPAGTFKPYVYPALHATMDIVEAAKHLGMAEEATAHVRVARQLGIAGIAPLYALLTAGAAGIAAEDDSVATQLFEEAVATPGAELLPFELARVRLAFGERLRQGRSEADSHRELERALDTFEAIEATPWAERCESLLRA
jgi:hypothetical protein